MNAASALEDTNGFRGSGDPRYPGLALALLAALVPVTVTLQLFTAVLFIAIVPVGDLAPVFVLVAASIASRWRGADRGWLAAARWLAAVMIAEWIVLYVLFASAQLGFRLDESAVMMFEPGLMLYAFESLALVVVTATAAVLSIIGMVRARRP